MAGHMVVDKASFQQMVTREVRKGVDTNLRQMRAQADERLFNAHDTLERDRFAVAELLKAAVEIERRQIRDLIEKGRKKKQEEVGSVSSSSGTGGGNEELLSSLERVLDDGQRKLDVIFTNPFFRKEEEEEPTTSGQ
ncbi:hypothetical protein IQ274_32790 [Nostoc sp. LEGE 12447]|uniref:hypothetical protein n=1 Tax=Nostoc sp. LEGE 12447 TaxID=1828640 RepID=UPI001A02ECDA|nr:hypothetical protein [Nostoc sp. LEGE 12447]MBE9002834.1 hypothetical protein [Nostoc sp. LEGE 12447]